MLNHSLVPVGSTGYSIDNSLRFNDDDSAYLSRTFSGTPNTYTLSMWCKPNSLGVSRILAATRKAGGYVSYINFTDADQLRMYSNDILIFQTTAKFRDPSAWYHIFISVVQSGAVKVYVNNVQHISTTIGSASNLFTSTAGFVNVIGRYGDASSSYYDGYLAEVNFVDGQALTPSDFGETGDYGEWKPIKYTGTYGTNGFYLDFENSGSLGADVSGNGNNWTPTNLTANDQMLDSPTNNFATLNPLQRVDGSSSLAFSEGNTELKNTSSSIWAGSYGNMEVSSGKWYWEVVSTSQNYLFAGIQQTGGTAVDWDAVSPQDRIGSIFYYYYNGNKKVDGTYSAYGSPFVVGDIIGVALDMTGETVTFYKNGTSQGSLAFSLSTYSGNSVVPANVTILNHIYNINFGQDSSFAGNKTAQGNSDGNGIGDFYYTPPTGYLALCTQNLPEPTVVPSEHFNTVLYSGTNAVQSITGVGFQPDLVWAKGRSVANPNYLHDAVRTVAYRLNSGITDGEYAGLLDSFDSDGFTINTSGGGMNSSGDTYVAWNWKANGAGVSNTDGTITSTVSVNDPAGFSIFKYNAGGSGNFTVGHGLTTAPEMVIVKRRDSTGNWFINHKDLGYQTYIFLDSTGASFNHGYSYLEVSGNVITSTGTSSTKYDSIAYAFHSVEGYSKVGSYTGNGSTDGTFVHCGFRPAYVMIKVTGVAGYNWYTFDSDRSEYNQMDKALFPNSSGAEYSPVPIDFLSNGFKLRTTDGGVNNASYSPYIFLAFAESPFKYSTAK